VATEPILKLIAVQLEDRDYPKAEMRDAQVRWLGLLRGGVLRENVLQRQEISCGLDRRSRFH
jgi:hypothetical protein